MRQFSTRQYDSVHPDTELLRKRTVVLTAVFGYICTLPVYSN